MVQGYPPIIEAQEEDEEDDEEEDDEDEAMSVSLSSERNQAGHLGDTGGKSPLGRSGQKTTGRSSRRSRRKIQEITLTTLDPSNLSPRWVSPPSICLSACVGLRLCGSVAGRFLSFFGTEHVVQTSGGRALFTKYKVIVNKRNSQCLLAYSLKNIPTNSQWVISRQTWTSSS